MAAIQQSMPNCQILKQSKYRRSYIWFLHSGLAQKLHDTHFFQLVTWHNILIYWDIDITIIGDYTTRTIAKWVSKYTVQIVELECNVINWLVYHLTLFKQRWYIYIYNYIIIFAWLRYQYRQFRNDYFYRIKYNVIGISIIQ